MPCQCVINFRMAGDGLFLSCGGMNIDVVTGTVTKQLAALLGYLSYQFVTFHKAISLISYCSGTSSISII